MRHSAAEQYAHKLMRKLKQDADRDLARGKLSSAMTAVMACAQLHYSSDLCYTDPELERYWEQTALLYKKENYRVAVRECRFEDIVEIDSFSELKSIDSSYR